METTQTQTYWTVQIGDDSWGYFILCQWKSYQRENLCFSGMCWFRLEPRAQDVSRSCWLLKFRKKSSEEYETELIFQISFKKAKLFETGSMGSRPRALHIFNGLRHGPCCQAPSGMPQTSKNAWIRLEVKSLGTRWVHAAICQRSQREKYLGKLEIMEKNISQN